MKLLLGVLLIPLLIVSTAFAESQTLPTDKGTLDVKLTYDDIIPNNQTKITVDFINPQTGKVQEHIDYTIKVSKEGENVFGPIPFLHTTIGTVKIPIEFNLGEGLYTMDVDIEGILWQPIPRETTSFDIAVGKAHAAPALQDREASAGDSMSGGGDSMSGGENGSCLIATAAHGSEMSPQVQQLRELRDNVILQTDSGTAFMASFNQFYYSFSPGIADYERENPIFKEIVKMGLTPMLASLSILNHVEINSEQDMLGYGISVILLNAGMYVGIPIFGILKLYQFRKN